MTYTLYYLSLQIINILNHFTVYSLRVVAKLSSVMISLKCSGSSKKRRMEDRDATRTSRTSTLHPSRTCTLHPSRRSTLLGGDHPTGADDKAPYRRLLQPPALGQDCARAPYDRYLPSAADDIARTTDCLPPSCRPPTWTSDCSTPSCRSPSRCLAWGGDIPGNTEDDTACAHLPVRGHHFLSGPTPVTPSCR